MKYNLKIRTKFLFFVIVIHAVVIALSFYIFKNNKIFFIGSEVFIIISLMLCWGLYNDLIEPIQLMKHGLEAIRDRDFNVKFLKTNSDEINELVDVYNTMIDHLRTERTYQQEQHFFLEKLIQTSPTGIIILDFDDKIISINPSASHILGQNEAFFIDKKIQNIEHPIFKNIENIKIGTSKTVTNDAKTFKIHKAQFIDRGFRRVFVVIEELTAEILEAEKRAYGKVIRMMAHEVNNSIGAVNSILDTTSEHFTQDEEVRHALKIAINRNDNLNHFMRNFADIIRLPEPRFELIDVNELVKNVAKLMQFRAEERQVSFVFELSEYPLSCRADAQQMEQVLINIIKNSIEAIDIQGFIKFKTNNKTKTLIVEDNGKGISEADVEKLFSPFYSNKKGGQGIGLTLTREILSNHGFLFSLKTQETTTVFEIVFK